MKFALVVSAAALAAALVTPSMAADLIIEEPVYTPGVVEVGGDWEGVYLGVFIGGASGESDHDPATIPNPGFFLTPEGNDIDVSGYMVGATVGVNTYLTEGVVGGIAADIAWSDISGTGVDDDWDLEHTINWQGSLRGVLGFDGGAFMPYLTGGLAVANATREDFDADDSASATHLGWTVGVGVQIAATEDLAIDLQYRYSDFGSQTYDYGSEPEIGLTQHAVTAGLNWKF